jgi:putative intracellular protease/amidase
MEVHTNDQRLQNPKPIAKASSDTYDAVVFPGDHGTEWDLNQDTHARALLREMVESDDDQKALVICHAVGLLAFTRDSNGGFLVDGRNVTGFPNEWEGDIVDDNGLMPDGRKLPYYVEDEVKAAGANWDAEVEEDISVTVDGNLITARGPESSHDGVMELIEALGVTPGV